MCSTLTNRLALFYTCIHTRPQTSYSSVCTHTLTFGKAVRLAWLRYSGANASLRALTAVCEGPPCLMRPPAVRRLSFLPLFSQPSVLELISLLYNNILHSTPIRRRVLTTENDLSFVRMRTKQSALRAPPTWLHKLALQFLRLGRFIFWLTSSYTCHGLITTLSSPPAERVQKLVER